MKVLSVLLCVLLFCTVVPAQDVSHNVWREHTFKDFIDGSFDDGGANMYVSSAGRIQMVNRWDVNNDTNIDILCVNSHNLVEMLDLSIYWGNGEDFSIRNHSYVPANGPMWVTPADLNNDGAEDLVVANYSNGTWTEMESFVYYGGLPTPDYKKSPEEWAFYPFRERIRLPSSNAQKAAVADFNRDGYNDIVFAFSGGFWEYRDKTKEDLSPSRIYWGGKTGFNPEDYLNIWTRGATDVAVGDLNDDGWSDLVFSNGESSMSFLYYGSGDGFSEDHMVKLPTSKAHAVEIGDVNNDGSSDIVFANEQGMVSVAYLNKGGTFNPEFRLEFRTYTAKDILVEDFNRDGYNDVFFTNHQFSLSGDPRLANRLIDSYLYFGFAEGFREENRQSIPTIGAWGANAADLNEDGWTDLLVCNFQEHYSYEVPSFVYWNGPDGFSVLRRTPLYEHGAQGNAIADFNGDGHLDIVITSMMGNSRGDYDPSYLYFGTENGQYSRDNRIELPGREAYEQAFADLDDDGQVEVLLLNRGEVTRLANELWIYWNDENRFDPWNMSGLPSFGGLGVEVADLDRDGCLDIIISNGNELQTDETGNPRPGSFIYWGGPEGYKVTGRTELPIVMTRSCAVCDINQDGHLDLVFGQQGKWGDASIFYGNGTRIFPESRRIRIKGSAGTGSPGVADLNKDGRLDIAFAHDTNVLIYYQTADGAFPLEAMQKIPVTAKTMCVADVNQDGWLDLICPYYKGEGRRSWHSTILLGSSKGYSLDQLIRLPTDGATGSIVSDFNRDTYMDVFFFCHRADGSFDETGRFGDHHTNSFLYWGSAEGFNEHNRLEIPSVGAHYDVGIDIGHIRDRGFRYTYESSTFHAMGKKPYRIYWEADTPGRASVKFQLRYAGSEEQLSHAEWTGPTDESDYYIISGSQIKRIPANQWIQYRAVFETENGAYSPILREVRLEFK